MRENIHWKALKEPSGVLQCHLVFIKQSKQSIKIHPCAFAYQCGASPPPPWGNVAFSGREGFCRVCWGDFVLSMKVAWAFDSESTDSHEPAGGLVKKEAHSVGEKRRQRLSRCWNSLLLHAGRVSSVQPTTEWKLPFRDAYLPARETSGGRVRKAVMVWGSSPGRRLCRSQMAGGY